MGLVLNADGTILVRLREDGALRAWNTLTWESDPRFRSSNGCKESNEKSVKDRSYYGMLESYGNQLIAFSKDGNEIVVEDTQGGITGAESSIAMNEIGIMYYCGQVGTLDRLSARQWFARAAAAGNQSALKNQEALEKNHTMNAPNLRLDAGAHLRSDPVIRRAGCVVLIELQQRSQRCQTGGKV